MTWKKSEVSRRILLKTGVWFSLLNLVLVFFVSYKYLEHIPSEIFSHHPFYTVLYTLSHFAFVAFIPFFFIYLPLTILTRNYRTSMNVAAFMATLSLILLVIDAYIFSLYRFHINSYVLEQVFGPGATQVFEFTLAQYFGVGAIFLTLFAVEVGFFKLASLIEKHTSIRLIYLCSAIIASLLTLTQVIHAVKFAQNDRHIAVLDRYYPAALSLRANDLVSLFGVSVEEGSVELDFKGKQYQYPLSPLQLHPTGKNLLVIAFDSWRASAMDSLITPNIYRFSQRSTCFTNHCSGSNGTRTGVFSMLYGLPGVYWTDFCQQSIPPLLLTELQKQRYELRLFPSASLYNPTLDKCAFYTVAEQCASTPGDKAWQRDENLAFNFLQFLEGRGEQSKPFFSFLFFDSLHSMIKPDDYKGPFQPSWEYAKYEKLGKNVDPTEFYALYKNMAFYLDSLVGVVLDSLSSKGLLENTVVVITGDHAQEFDDNRKGFWGHNGNFSRAQIQTPLVYYRGDSVPAVFDYPTTHYDLVPSMMEDVLGASNPSSDYSIGYSLFDSTRSGASSFRMVDSYIGMGIIAEDGSITNLYYDGDYECTDSLLTPRFDQKVDAALYNQALRLISRFYK